MRNVIFAAVGTVCIALAGASGASAAPVNASTIAHDASSTSIVSKAYCRVHRWCEHGRCWVHRHCW
jgi:hypothetical protein